MKIMVLGAGSWGTALSVLLLQNGHEVTLWSWQEEQVKFMLRTRENKLFLPGVHLEEGIRIVSDLAALKECEVVVAAVPSNAVREVCRLINPFISTKALIVNTAKGFDPHTLQRLSEVINEELPQNRTVVLSGPSHAEEVARALPTTIVAAGISEDETRLVQDIFMNSFFRVYTNSDLLGVEICGAVKNVIAIGTGISEGLKLGDNAKAALITRGLAEITRLGMAMGAFAGTFQGLAGLGDLVVTCGSMHSRNRRAGIAIGEGGSPEDISSKDAMVVEGFFATKNTYLLAQRHNIRMPITEQIYQVLYHAMPPREALLNLMNREKASERSHA